MKTKFESNAVRTAAQDGRITTAEAERIVSQYQLSGTINPPEGCKIEQDVSKLESGNARTRVSKRAMDFLSLNIPGVQLFGGPRVGCAIDHGARFESSIVKDAVKDGRVTSAEADKIMAKWSISGTIDPDGGFAITRDVLKLLESPMGVSFDPVARFRLSQLSTSPQPL